MFGKRAENRIPGFKIERQIAEGGMATVYLAVQESLARPVALKILKQSGNPSFSERFLSEGRTVASLRHQNVVTIHDIGIIKEQHYISMEFVEGGDLSAAIQSGFKPNEALRIIQQLAACLSFVHKQRVVHRDIKPANILFREDGIPLLTDFGIAKQLNSDSKLTQDGTALGSPQYLSPEQGLGQKVDGRSDIYSLGIVLYEMLAGKPPFEGKTSIETVMMHVQQPLPPLKRSLMRFMPLLQRMTAKKTTERFRNCDELERAIGELLNDTTTKTPVRTSRKTKQAVKRTAAVKSSAKLPKPREKTDISPTMTMTMGGMAEQKPQLSQHAYTWLAMIPIALASAGTVYWQDWFPSIDTENPIPLVFDWNLAKSHIRNQSVKPTPASQAQPATTSQVTIEPKSNNRLSAQTPLPEQNRHNVAAVIKKEDAKPSRTAVISKPGNKPAKVSKAPVKPTKSTRSPSKTSQTRRKHAVGKKIVKKHTIAKTADKSEPIRQPSSSANIKLQKRYMVLAKQRLSKKKLTRPKRDNAAYYYRKVLKLDPTHQDAQKGLATVAERYADLTLTASKRNDFDQAYTYLLRGLRIDPKNSRLIAMKSKFKAFDSPSK